MNTRASPTNSAPSRKKKDASPSNARTKQNAACMRFGNVAAASAPASVNTEMIMNTMLFIQRNDKHAAQIPSAIQQNRPPAVNNHDHEQRPQPSTQSAPCIMPNRSGDDACERHRQHEFPGDIHHLIHAHARE